MSEVDKVFQQATRRFQGIVVNAAEVKAEAFRREIEAHLRDYMERFYSEMFTQLDNVYTPIFETSAPLQLATRDAKVKLGKFEPPSYYRFTGDLQAQLLSRSPIRDFGKPQVTFSKRGRGRRRQTSVSVAGGIPRAGGRFVAFSEAFKDLVFDLEVNLYPRISQKNYKSVFSRYNQGLRQKLMANEFGRGGKRKIPARPLLRPTLEWYGNTNLRSSMKQRFGVDMK